MAKVPEKKKTAKASDKKETKAAKAVNEKAKAAKPAASKKADKEPAKAKTAAKEAGKKSPAKESAKAVEIETPAPVAAEAEPVKKRAPRKSKKAEQPTGLVIGSPRLAGLRHAPGVRIEAPKKAAPAAERAEDVKKLSKKEVSEIKQKLLAMRESNLSNLRKKLEEDQERSAKMAADIIDQASDACDEDISLEIASTKDEQLQLINTALENIENGTYGQCIMCGGPIPASRLRLLPFVVRCRDCKTIYEASRRRHDANWALVNGGGNDDVESEEPVEE